MGIWSPKETLRGGVCALAGAIAALGMASVAAGCTGKSSPLAPAPPASQQTATGRVTATNGGQPLSGISLTTPTETVTSGDAGVFELRIGNDSTIPVTITGASIVMRTLAFSSVADVLTGPEVFVRDQSFDLDFYREFARNGHEQPSNLQPIRRWTGPFQVYLKTVDEAGKPVDAVTLAMTEATIADTAEIWTGGRVNLAGIVRGTGTRAGQPGWITVRWANPAQAGGCGLSTVGIDGGWIELNHLGQGCRCGGPALVYPRLVRHELGHALGFYHTGNAEDVMYGRGVSPGACDLRPSERERRHARYVYSRPVGNTDPDNDPLTAVRDLRPRSIAVQP